MRAVQWGAKRVWQAFLAAILVLAVPAHAAPYAYITNETSNNVSVIDTAGNAGRAPDAAQVRQRMAGLAVPFEANTGQHDKRVAFTARTLGGTLFVTRAGQLVHSFPGQPVAEQAGTTERKAMQKRGPGWVLTETLVNAHPVLREGSVSATRVSRFIGNDPAQWQPEIATFQTVSLGAAWPGIEVELAARGNNVEKLFTVAPGADARRIAIRVGGAERFELAADGALVAHTGNGPVSFTAPVAWQDIDGGRQPVKVAYALSGQRYGFVLGDYNPAYPVQNDPESRRKSIANPSSIPRILQ